MRSESEKYTRLITDGFWVFEQVLDETMLAQVRAASNRLLSAQLSNILRNRSQPGA